MLDRPRDYGVDLTKKPRYQPVEELGREKCAIQRTRCAYIAYTTMLDRPGDYGVDPTKKPRYQPVEDCTYRPVLESPNNCNNNKFTN